MPLFVCENCNCVDNTACGGTFWKVLHERGGKLLCCECNSGKWHNKFPKEIATKEEVIEIREYWKKQLSSSYYELIYKESENGAKYKI